MNNPSIFPYCLERVLKLEGGSRVVDDPDDPGGRTAWGIAERSHPAAWKDGVPTKEEAVLIYKKYYWDAARCGELPSMLCLVVFDSCVNQGVKRSSTFLQQAIARPDIAIDGKIGDKTIAAAAMCPDKKQLLRDFTTFRIKHYADIPHFTVYWKGWLRRAVEVTMDSAIFDNG